VSRDGKYVVIGDWSGSGGTDYSVYLGKNWMGSPLFYWGGGVAVYISRQQMGDFHPA